MTSSSVARQSPSPCRYNRHFRPDGPTAQKDCNRDGFPLPAEPGQTGRLSIAGRVGLPVPLAIDCLASYTKGFRFVDTSPL